MTNSFDRTLLSWLDDKQPTMQKLLFDLCQINSGTFHLEGLESVKQRLLGEFDSLGGQSQVLELSPFEQVDSRGKVIAQELGDAIQFIKRPDARKRVFLCIHMDTVYAASHPFQQCEYVDEQTLRGPGVADAKGGIVVMLFALKCLEESPLAEQIGWEVVINPDEEMGSPGSSTIFQERASESDFGLLFEPAYPDGSLVDKRKGSGNFTFVVGGKAAHSGREFDKGRNAIVKAAELVTRINSLNGKHSEVTFNVGQIEGGRTPNMVPDMTIVRLNVRVAEPGQIILVEEELEKLVQEVNGGDFTCQQLGNFSSPPKILDSATQSLQNEVTRCCEELEIEVSWTETGGACDGNKLAAAGLPNIDTLGVVGGEIHSEREYVMLDSLVPRAKLTSLLLMKYATGEFTMPVSV